MKRGKNFEDSCRICLEWENLATYCIIEYQIWIKKLNV